jgi:geranylgeranyl diphosphate synthase type II
MDFNLELYLNEKRKVIDDFLQASIPSKGTEPRNLIAAMRYSLFAGGKRIRPILAIATCETFDAEFERILHGACALEMIHTYSLIHDDLPAIDNDELRRGKPSSHVVFGEGMAILAGDALLTRAFEVLSSERWKLPLRSRLSIIRDISASAGIDGMLGGQEYDVISQGKAVSEEDVKRIHHHKTAAMIRCAVTIGAIAAGANRESIHAVSRAGMKMGLAFQVIDDILGIISSPETLGKPVGSDYSSKKATYPKVAGLEKSRAYAGMLIDETCEILATLDDRDTRILKEIARFIAERPS